VTDAPDFAVIAVLGGRSAEIQKSAVHVYAWDRGDHHELRLRVGTNLAAIGIKGSMKIRKFVTALQAADPATTCDGL